MTAKRLFVLGSGGHGKVVADVGRSAGWELAGFVDDAPERVGKEIWGVPVISWAELVRRAADGDVAVALGVGDNAARERVAQRLQAAGLPLASVVHATAVVAESARVGPGTVVMANAVVNPDAEVGAGAILNTGCVVEHDCRLADYVHLSPKAALGGAVTIGERSHLGVGAVALPGVHVGADVRVGAGAVVHRDVSDGLTVVGVPARPLDDKGEGKGSR